MLWSEVVSYLGIAVAVITVAGALLYFVGSGRRKYYDELRRERAAYTEEEFVGYFASMQIPRFVARAVYSKLSQATFVQDFPVLPGDNLNSLYPDWQEEVEPIWIKCRCSDATAEDFQRARITTVEDLVKYVDRFCRHEGQGEDGAG